jgi:hypothetical protein
MPIVPLSSDTLCTPAHIRQKTADGLRPFAGHVAPRPGDDDYAIQHGEHMP